MLPDECGCRLLYLGADRDCGRDRDPDPDHAHGDPDHAHGHPDRDPNHDRDRDHDRDHDSDRENDPDHDSDLKYLLRLPRIIFSLPCCRMNAAVVYFI
jgi:hypothetical protein